MINRKTKQVILEIPKSGSRSLVQAAIQGHGKKVFACHGHHTFEETLKLMPNFEPSEVVAVLRNPEFRFISQINEYVRIKNSDLDSALKACIEQSHVIFKPQHLYLVNVRNYETHIYPLEKCLEAQIKVAGKVLKKVYHQNKGDSRRKYSVRQIVGHPRYYEAMDLYSLDWPLYEAAAFTLKEGKLQ